MADAPLDLSVSKKSNLPKPSTISQLPPETQSKAPFSKEVPDGSATEKHADVSAGSEKSDEITSFRCCFCGLAFTSTEILLQHIRIHTGDEDEEGKESGEKESKDAVEDEVDDKDALSSDEKHELESSQQQSPRVSPDTVSGSIASASSWSKVSGHAVASLSFASGSSKDEAVVKDGALLAEQGVGEASSSQSLSNLDVNQTTTCEADSTVDIPARLYCAKSKTPEKSTSFTTQDSNSHSRESRLHDGASGGVRYTCPLCHVDFDNHIKQQQHQFSCRPPTEKQLFMQKFSLSENLTCPFCKVRFSSTDARNIHHCHGKDTDIQGFNYMYSIADQITSQRHADTGTPMQNDESYLNILSNSWTGAWETDSRPPSGRSTPESKRGRHCEGCDKSFEFSRNLHRHLQCNPACRAVMIAKDPSSVKKGGYRFSFMKSKSLEGLPGTSDTSESSGMNQSVGKGSSLPPARRERAKRSWSPKGYTCHKCGKSFQDGLKLGVHMRWKHRRVQYIKPKVKHHGIRKSERNLTDKVISCRACQKTFKLESNLELHLTLKKKCRIQHAKLKTLEANSTNDDNSTSDMTQVGGRDRPACKVCGHRYWSAWHLRAHMRACHKNVPVSKEEVAIPGHLACRKYYTQENVPEVYKHLEVRNELVVCTFCKQIFSQKRTGYNHVLIHLEINPFKCLLCDYKGRQVACVLKHIKTNHLDVLLAENSSKADDSSKTNDLADAKQNQPDQENVLDLSSTSAAKMTKVGVSKKKLNAKKSPAKKVEDREAGTVKNVDFVYSPSKSEDDLLKECPGGWKCTYCDAVYGSKSRTVCHIRKHTKARPYKCCYCTFTASYSYMIYQHLRKHHFKNRPVRAPIIKNKGRGRGTILEHQQSPKPGAASRLSVPPTNTSPVNLPKNASYYSSFFKALPIDKKYAPIRVGKDVWKCYTCDESSNDPSVIRTHTLTHTRLQPFHCLLCPFKMGRLGKLISHLQKQHGAELQAHFGSNAQFEDFDNHEEQEMETEPENDIQDLHKTNDESSVAVQNLKASGSSAELGQQIETQHVDNSTADEVSRRRSSRGRHIKPQKTLKKDYVYDFTESESDVSQNSASPMVKSDSENQSNMGKKPQSDVSSLPSQSGPSSSDIAPKDGGSMKFKVLMLPGSHEKIYICPQCNFKSNYESVIQAHMAIKHSTGQLLSEYKATRAKSAKGISRQSSLSGGGVLTGQRSILEWMPHQWKGTTGAENRQTISSTEASVNQPEKTADGMQGILDQSPQGVVPVTVQISKQNDIIDTANTLYTYRAGPVEQCANFDTEPRGGYRCSYCKERPRGKAAAIAHLQEHTGEKPFCCDLCDVKEAHRSTILTHIQGCHMDQVVDIVEKKSKLAKESSIINAADTEATEESSGLEDLPTSADDIGDSNYDDSTTDVDVNENVAEMVDAEVDLTNALPITDMLGSSKPFNLKGIRKKNLSFYKQIIFVRGPKEENLHIEQDEATGRFLCPYCKKTFSGRNATKQHSRIHTHEKPYYCKLCYHNASTISSIMKHLQAQHKDDCRTRRSLPRISKSSLAEVKKMRLRKQETGDDEASAVRKNDQDPAEEVEEDVEEVQENEKSDGDKEEHVEEKEKPGSPHILQEFFKFQPGEVERNLHLKVDQSGLSKCPFCNKVQLNSFNTKRHIRTHTGEKPYSCNLCDYVGTQWRSIRFHLVKKHADVDKITAYAAEADREFQDPELLQDEDEFAPEIPTLSVEKVTEAADAKDSTTVPQGSSGGPTQAHKLTPIKDDNQSAYDISPGKRQWNAKWTTLYEYEPGPMELKYRNIKRHIISGCLQCPLCEKDHFREKGKLLSHLRSHSGEKPYRCNLCMYRAGQQSTIVHHVRNYHKLTEAPLEDKKNFPSKEIKLPDNGDSMNVGTSLQKPSSSETEKTPESSPSPEKSGTERVLSPTPDNGAERTPKSRSERTLSPTSKSRTEKALSPASKSRTEKAPFPTPESATERERSPSSKDEAERVVSPTPKSRTERELSATPKSRTERELFPTSKRGTERVLSPTPKSGTERALSPTQKRGTERARSPSPKGLRKLWEYVPGDQEKNLVLFKDSDTDYTCPFCHKEKFTQIRTLKAHIRTHTMEEPFHCKMCDYKCRQQSSIRHHMLKEHSAACHRLGVGDFTIESIHVEDTASTSMTSDAKIADNVPHGSPPMVERNETESKVDDGDVESAAQEQAKGTTQPMGSKSVDDTATKSKRQVAFLHSEETKDFGPYTFTCGKMESRLQRRVSQLERDAITGTFLCSYCAQGFTTKYSYVVHVRLHTGEKPYKCKLCAHQVAQHSSIKYHIKTHHSEKEIAEMSVSHNAMEKDEEGKSPLDEEEQESIQKAGLPVAHSNKSEESEKMDIDQDRPRLGDCEESRDTSEKVVSTSGEITEKRAADAKVQSEDLITSNVPHASQCTPQFVSKQVSNQTDQSSNPTANLPSLQKAECILPSKGDVNMLESYLAQNKTHTRDAARSLIKYTIGMVERNLSYKKDPCSDKFICPFCQHLFKSLDAAKRHVRLHTGERPYHCSICSSQEFKESKMIQHMVERHGRQVVKAARKGVTQSDQSKDGEESDGEIEMEVKQVWACISPFVTYSLDDDRQVCYTCDLCHHTIIGYQQIVMHLKRYHKVDIQGIESELQKEQGKDNISQTQPDDISLPMELNSQNQSLPSNTNAAVSQPPKSQEAKDGNLAGIAKTNTTLFSMDKMQNLVVIGQQEKTTNKSFVCNKCGHTTDNQSNMVSHIAGEHPEAVLYVNPANPQGVALPTALPAASPASIPFTPPVAAPVAPFVTSTVVPLIAPSNAPSVVQLDSLSAAPSFFSPVVLSDAPRDVFPVAPPGAPSVAPLEASPVAKEHPQNAANMNPVPVNSEKSSGNSSGEPVAIQEEKQEIVNNEEEEPQQQMIAAESSKRNKVGITATTDVQKDVTLQKSHGEPVATEDKKQEEVRRDGNVEGDILNHEKAQQMTDDEKIRREELETTNVQKYMTLRKRKTTSESPSQDANTSSKDQNQASGLAHDVLNKDSEDEEDRLVIDLKQSLSKDGSQAAEIELKSELSPTDHNYARCKGRVGNRNKNSATKVAADVPKELSSKGPSDYNDVVSSTRSPKKMDRRRRSTRRLSSDITKNQDQVAVKTGDARDRGGNDCARIGNDSASIPEQDGGASIPVSSTAKPADTPPQLPLPSALMMAKSVNKVESTASSDHPASECSSMTDKVQDLPNDKVDETCITNYFTRNIGNAEKTLGRNFQRDKVTGFYLCPYCDKSSRLLQTTKIHMRLHTGEKPYECKLCDVKTVQHCSIINHIKNHHPEVLGIAPPKEPKKTKKRKSRKGAGVQEDNELESPNLAAVKLGNRVKKLGSTSPMKTHYKKVSKKLKIAEDESVVDLQRSQQILDEAKQSEVKDLQQKTQQKTVSSSTKVNLGTDVVTRSDGVGISGLKRFAQIPIPKLGVANLTQEFLKVAMDKPEQSVEQLRRPTRSCTIKAAAQDEPSTNGALDLSVHRSKMNPSAEHLALSSPQTAEITDAPAPSENQKEESSNEGVLTIDLGRKKRKYKRKRGKKMMKKARMSNMDGEKQIEPKLSNMDGEQQIESKDDVSSTPGEKGSRKRISKPGIQEKYYRIEIGPIEKSLKFEKDPVTQRTKCPFCSMTLSHLWSTYNHVRLHTGERPFKCNLCDYKSVQLTSIRTHLSKNHQDIMDADLKNGVNLSQESNSNTNNSNGNSNSAVKNSPVDSATAASIAAIKKSIANSSDVANSSSSFNVYNCFSFVEPEGIQTQQFKKDPVSGLMICPHCKTPIPRRALVEHVCSHTGDLPYRCKLCVHKTTKRSAMIRHIQMYHKEDAFSKFVPQPCEGPRVSRLNVQKDARGLSPVSKNKKLKKKNRLRVKMGYKKSAKEASSGTIPERNDASEMAAEEEVGNPEKRPKSSVAKTSPYLSKLREFYALSVSKKEKRLVIQKLKGGMYKCPFCPNEFPRSADVKRHARVHTGDKPYRCRLCNQTSRQQDAMLKHIKKIHAAEFKAAFASETSQTDVSPTKACNVITPVANYSEPSQPDKDTSAKTSEISRSLEGMTSKDGEASGVIEEAAAKTRKVLRSMKEITTKTGEVSESVEEMTFKISKASKSLEETAVETSEALKSVEEIHEKTDKISASVEETSKGSSCSVKYSNTPTSSSTTSKFVIDENAKVVNENIAKVDENMNDGRMSMQEMNDKKSGEASTAAETLSNLYKPDNQTSAQMSYTNAQDLSVPRKGSESNVPQVTSVYSNKSAEFDNQEPMFSEDIESDMEAARKPIEDILEELLTDVDDNQTGDEEQHHSAKETNKLEQHEAQNLIVEKQGNLNMRDVDGDEEKMDTDESNTEKSSNKTVNDKQSEGAATCGEQMDTQSDSASRLASNVDTSVKGEEKLEPKSVQKMPSKTKSKLPLAPEIDEYTFEDDPPTSSENQLKLWLPPLAILGKQSCMVPKSSQNSASDMSNPKHAANKPDQSTFSSPSPSRYSTTKGQGSKLHYSYDPCDEDTMDVTSESNSSMYKCPHCSYRHRTKSVVRIHIRTHTGFKPYLCHYCDYTSTHCATIKKHLWKEHNIGEDPKSSSSSDSDTKYSSKVGESIHFKFSPSDEEKNLDLKRAGDKGAFLCSYCNRPFSTEGNLRIHIRTHTGDKPYHCRYCEFRTAYGFLMQKHINMAHKEKHGLVQNDDSNRPTMGQDYAFNPSEEEKNRVLRRSRGSDMYKCEVCGRESVHEFDAVAHMRTHTGDTPYSCAYCDTQTKTQVQIVKHVSDMHKSSPKKTKKLDN